MIRDLRNIVRDFLMPNWIVVDINHMRVVRQLEFMNYFYETQQHSSPNFACWVYWRNQQDRFISGQ